MAVAERLKSVRKEKNFSQKEFAEYLDSHQVYISELERGLKTPSVKFLMAMSEKTKTNIHWLLTGQGNKEVGSLDSIVRINSQFKTNNILVPIKAQAGYLDGEFVDQSDVLDYVYIPGFTAENYRTFEVEGDSMSPTLMPGDLVVCVQVEKMTELKNQEIYVVITNQSGIIIKRITVDHKEEIIVLSSDSPSHRTYQTPFSDVREIWKVRARITNFLSDRLLPLELRMAQLESKLAKK